MHDQFSMVLGVILADSPIVSVENSLIAGFALVAAALAPTLFGRKEREPKSIRDLRAAEKNLRDEIAKDRDEWKTRADEADGEIKLKDAEILRLQQLAIAHGADPFANKTEGA